MKNLNILSIECGVAGFQIGVFHCGKKFEMHSVEKQSDNLVSEIKKMLSKAKLDVDDIDVLGVGIGPGSFTGIRVAVSVVKGILSVKPKKLVIFDSFELFAYDRVECDYNDFIVVDGFSKFVFAKQKDKLPICIDVSELKNLIKPSTRVITQKHVFEKIGKGDFIDSNLNALDLVIYKTKKEDFSEMKNLVPIYLRASQAEIEREKRIKDNKND